MNALIKKINFCLIFKAILKLSESVLLRLQVICLSCDRCMETW